jgi:hypothetical protein
VNPIERAFCAGFKAACDGGVDSRLDAAFVEFIADHPDPPSAADLATLRRFCGTDHARTEHPKTYDTLIRLLAAWT